MSVGAKYCRNVETDLGFLSALILWQVPLAKTARGRTVRIAKQQKRPITDAATREYNSSHRHAQRTEGVAPRVFMITLFLPLGHGQERVENLLEGTGENRHGTAGCLEDSSSLLPS